MKNLKISGLLTLLTFIILTSCKKEEFPDIDNLTGTWVEQTDNSFKHKLIFEKETLYFIKQNTVDTLSYRLDEKQELIYLSLKSNPSEGESNHKILLNKKKDTLTIWGLFSSTPENVTETVFKKE